MKTRVIALAVFVLVTAAACGDSAPTTTTTGNAAPADPEPERGPGIEKVVEKLSDVPPLLEILTKSATGQPITTYFNMISRPRQADELDGPEAVHLVLLDNGRSRIRVDEELLDTLRCIRCGACINHCPVYVQLGGHAYGTVYPGPIGIALEPQRIGIDKVGTLPSACTMCGACGEVCPVRIPLPKLINRVRAEAVAKTGQDDRLAGRGALRSPREALIWRCWSWVYASPGRYALAAWFATRLRRLAPKRIGGWTRYRSAPRPAARSRLVETRPAKSPPRQPTTGTPWRAQILTNSDTSAVVSG